MRTVLPQGVTVEEGIAEEITWDLEAEMQEILATSVINGLLEQTCRSWMKGKDSPVQNKTK